MQPLHYKIITSIINFSEEKCLKDTLYIILHLEKERKKRKNIYIIGFMM